MTSQKALHIVTPANAGVQNSPKRLDSGFRRNDGKIKSATFYEFIIFYFKR
jgi:hypothetical protein